MIDGAQTVARQMPFNSGGAHSVFGDVLARKARVEAGLALSSESRDTAWLEETLLEFFMVPHAGPYTYTGQFKKGSGERLGIAQEPSDLVAGRVAAWPARIGVEAEVHRRGRGRGRTPQRTHRDHGNRPIGTFNKPTQR